jgi:hypothetical protein
MHRRLREEDWPRDKRSLADWSNDAAGADVLPAISSAETSAGWLLQMFRRMPAPHQRRDDWEAGVRRVANIRSNS